MELSKNYTMNDKEINAIMEHLTKVKEQLNNVEGILNNSIVETLKKTA